MPENGIGVTLTIIFLCQNLAFNSKNDQHIFSTVFVIA